MNIDIELLWEILGIVATLTPALIFFFKTYGRIRDFIRDQQDFQKRVEIQNNMLRENLEMVHNQIVMIHTSDRIQSEGLQSLLREHLLSIMEPCIYQNYVDDHTRENVEHMYEAYRSLGGNGMIEALHKQFAELKPSAREISK